MVRMRIDDLLAEHGKSSYWLANEIGLNHASMSLLRRNKLKSISFELIENLCDRLECSPGDLMEIVKEKPSSKKSKSKG